MGKGLQRAFAAAKATREKPARLERFANMPDADFIRAVLRGSRYLDNQSRENAREALRRLDRLHPPT